MTVNNSILSPVGAGSWDWLICPSCASALSGEAGKLRCTRCRSSWPVVDGVPQFVDQFPYWGEIPVEKMRAINDAGRRGSWKAPLLESTDPDVVRASAMILNLARANWQWLVDLPRNSRVLDLGAGTGTNSHALGMRFSDVVAVEPVQERIDFMRQRFAQEGLAHVKPMRSSVWVLPFPAESFDLVAMNGVLEWVATGSAGRPGEMQEAALENVFRLLRPGGYLYVGIENRLSLGCFLGYPDPHCGLPWVTVLPRRLADWYARWRGQKEGYRNHLYSAAGYRRLLEKTGFQSCDMYLALPSYNHPRFLMPLDDNVYEYYVDNFTYAPGKWPRRLGRDMLLKTGLLKFAEHSFVILARK